MVFMFLISIFITDMLRISRSASWPYVSAIGRLAMPTCQVCLPAQIYNKYVDALTTNVSRIVVYLSAISLGLQ